MRIEEEMKVFLGELVAYKKVTCHMTLGTNPNSMLFTDLHPT